MAKDVIAMEKSIDQMPWSVAGPDDFEQRLLPLVDLMTPGAGVVHLWFLDLVSLGASLQHALAGGSAASPGPMSPEQIRFVRRFYLKLLLGAYLGIPGKSVRINRSSRGKPSLDHSVHDSDLQFSMAKSGGSLMMGFTSGVSVGVDLEPCCRTARNALGLARRYFSPAESAVLETLAAEQIDGAFLRTWACKEAVVKASGHGIANQFNCFTVNSNPLSSPELITMEGDDASFWQLKIVQPGKDFIGAIASRQSSLKVETFRLERALQA